MTNVIETKAALGDIAIGRRVDRGWWWTVVCDVSYPTMSVGGWARTAVGALIAARRAFVRTR